MEHFDMQSRYMEAYDRYADALFRYCIIRVRNRDIAKDLVQEAFFKAWTYVTEDKDIEHIQALLYRITRNAIIDLSRKKKESSLEWLRESANYDPPDPASYHQHDIIMESQALTYIDQLDEKYRDPIILRYIEDRSIKEIASLLHESENTISVRIYRGLQKLKTHFTINE